MQVAKWMVDYLRGQNIAELLVEQMASHDKMAVEILDKEEERRRQGLTDDKAAEKLKDTVERRVDEGKMQQGVTLMATKGLFASRESTPQILGVIEKSGTSAMSRGEFRRSTRPQRLGSSGSGASNRTSRREATLCVSYSSR
jgi:hypothetical protein